MLEYFGRQAQATNVPPSLDVHDIVGNDEHVVVLGSAKATAQDGSSAEWGTLALAACQRPAGPGLSGQA